MRPRFSLRWTLAALVPISVALAAVMNANGFWTFVVGLSSLAILGYGAVCILLRQGRQPFWLGFLVFSLGSIAWTLLVPYQAVPPLWNWPQQLLFDAIATKGAPVMSPFGQNSTSLPDRYEFNVIFNGVALLIVGVCGGGVAEFVAAAERGRRQGGS